MKVSVASRQAIEQQQLDGIASAGVDIDGMEEDSRFGFNIRPYYQKVLILFAGVFMNIILSFVAMFSISMYLGHIDETSNIITRSLSSEAILKVDDKVVEVNGAL